MLFQHLNDGVKLKHTKFCRMHLIYTYISKLRWRIGSLRIFIESFNIILYHFIIFCWTVYGYIYSNHANRLIKVREVKVKNVCENLATIKSSAAIDLFNYPPCHSTLKQTWQIFNTPFGKDRINPLWECHLLHYTSWMCHWKRESITRHCGFQIT